MNLKALWYEFNDSHSSIIFHPQFYLKEYSNSAIDLSVKYAKGVLLDIGCGRMPYKAKFSKKVTKYIGIDHPEVSVLYESLYSGYEKPDILADATKIPLKNSIADTIICMQVIEHFPDPDKALDEMKRLLKKGGNLIISTVQSYPLHNEPYDYRRFTKYGLMKIVEKHGLQVVRSKEEGNFFIQQSQNFNIYLMLILRRLVDRKNKIPVILLAPFILVATTAVNVLVWPLRHFDKNTKFAIEQTIVARK